MKDGFKAQNWKCNKRNDIYTLRYIFEKNTVILLKFKLLLIIKHKPRS